jgi:hypothetical protein
MKRLKAVWGELWVFCLLSIISFGCGDSGKSSPSNLSTRLNLLYAEDATLAPVVQNAGGGTASASGQKWEYTLTLENASVQIHAVRAITAARHMYWMIKKSRSTRPICVAIHGENLIITVPGIRSISIT